MAFLFNQKPAGLKTKYSGIRTQSATYGVSIPLVYGKNRIAGKLLWYGDFTATKDVNQSKKGGGSGVGKTAAVDYVYSAAIIAALCQGPCQGLESVWDATGKFVNTVTMETVTIGSGSGGFFDAYVSRRVQYATDYGVGQPLTFNKTFTDPGAPAAATLSGTHYQPMVKASGSNPAVGQYTVDPIAGKYRFNTADQGKAVQIWYSFFSFRSIVNELTVIPFVAPFSYTVEHQPYFSEKDATATVAFYPSGTALTQSGGASTQGTFDPNGGNFLFNSADAGKSVVINYEFDNVNAAQDQNAPKTLNLTFFNGAQSQAVWSYLTTKHPGQDLGYTQVAYVASSKMYLGFSPVMPNFNYEIIGLYPVGAGIADANPADCIASVLTDPSYGCGFPSPLVDQSLGGLARAYWAAAGFFISPVLDGHSSVGDAISGWLEASQVGCFWSEGVLKFVPYGDTTLIGNGFTYTPPTAAAVSLNDSDFVPGDNEDPVKVTRTLWQDAYNKVAVKYSVRINGYNEDVVYAQDDAAIDMFGLRKEAPVDWPFICEASPAQFAANLRVQRNVAYRNRYEFNLKEKYSFLEPMDVVTITDSNLGLNAAAVRIIAIDNDPTKPLMVIAEDFPWSISSTTLYPKQALSPSYALEAGHTSPGPTDLFVFEAPAALGNQGGNKIYIFCNSTNSNWGGCNLWVSYDNINYNLLTTVSTPGRFGTLANAINAQGDPDQSSLIKVNMENSAASLLSVTQDDADHYVSLSVLASSPFVLGLGNSPAVQNKLYDLRRGRAGSQYDAGSPWVLPGNFVASPSSGSVATQALVGNGGNTTTIGGRGLIQEFDFAFPAGAASSVQIRFNAAFDTSPTTGALTVTVALTDTNGTELGGAKTIQITSAAMTEYIVGAALASQQIEWGTNNTSAQMTSSPFGLTLRAALTGTSQTITARVNNVRMAVYSGAPTAAVQPPELIAYKDATLTAERQYTLADSQNLIYVRRGLYGTTPQRWGIGASFARLDGASFVYQYPQTMIGKTIFLKATSFNTIGDQQQLLADVNPLLIPLTGIIGAYDLGSGSTATGAGATPPSASNGFSYISDGSSVTWLWNTQVVRNDGTIQVLTGSQKIIGLAASTDYYFYPYLDDSNGTGKAVVSWVSLPTATGTPVIAFTLANKTNTAIQIQQTGSHIPLGPGAIKGTTTAVGGSGGGGGGSGGGGGGGCFSGNTIVRTFDYGTARFDELPTDRDFLVENETGVHFARLLVHENHTADMIDMGDGEWVTAEHLLLGDDGWVQADEALVGRRSEVKTMTVYNLHVITRKEEDRHYCLENGWVAHNKLILL